MYKISRLSLDKSVRMWYLWGMNQKQKDKITKISKEFFSGFSEMTDSINGTGAIIVDPLSGYLNFTGYPNTPKAFDATENSPLILMLVFEDGSCFVPAGEDLKGIAHKGKEDLLTNWMWFDKE